MATRWNEAIQLYAAEIAGAALRHDFGIPLGIIGRNAGFILELMEEGKANHLKPRSHEVLVSSCQSIGSISSNIHDAMRRLGRTIRSRPLRMVNSPAYEIRKVYSDVNNVVSPLLADLHRNVTILERTMLETTNRDILKNAIDLVSNARRVQAMYSGLNYFFRLEEIDDELFLPVELDILCSRTAKAVRSSNGFSNIIPVDGKATVECIETQIGLVIQNLILNAIKFTKHLKQPLVRVTMTIEPFLRIRRKFSNYIHSFEPGGNWLELHVEDNGLGIAPDALPKIFDLYFSGAAPTHIPKGSGMGLAISKLIVTVHGGMLFVNQQSPRTDFVLLLPERQEFGIDRRLLIKEEFSL
jgi:signal transduction histidine kinase